MPFQIDTSSDYGRRVKQRLTEERIIWLTTVSERGAPNPRPVWFLWDGESFLIYSRPNTRKIEHIKKNSRVSLNLDGDGLGGDIIVLIGDALIDDGALPADQVPAYVAKYTAGMERIGMTPAEFAQIYSIPIRVMPMRLRGH